MYTSNPLGLPPYEAHLSRQAAERYALLSAVKERRAQQRPTSRRRRVIPVLHRRLAIDAPSGSPGC